jgi:hypothetical protein
MCTEEVVIDKDFQVTNGNSAWKRTLMSFIAVNDPRLQISGLVMDCQLQERDVGEGEVNIPYCFLEFQNESEFVYIDIKPDRDNNTVLCMLIGEISHPHLIRLKTEKLVSFAPIQCSLVLQRQESGVYERVGISIHDRQNDVFKGARVETVEIA